MLTENDIQYLTAFLLMASDRSLIDVTVGKMVFDEASKSKRDVDVVTLTSRGETEATAYIGVEVKDHDRKLGSQHCEQLIQKLRDMPEIEKRFIVSASGYTKPGLHKCEFHNTTALSIVEWDPMNSPFGTVQFTEFEGFTYLQSEVGGPAGVSFFNANGNQVIRDSELSLPCIYENNGVVDSSITSVEDLCRKAVDTLQQNLPEPEKASLIGEEFQRMERFLEFEGDHVVTVAGTRRAFTKIYVHVHLRTVPIRVAPLYKALYNETLKVFESGAVLCIMPNQALLGITIDPFTFKPHIIHVTPEQRAKRVVRNFPLKSSS